MNWLLWSSVAGGAWLLLKKPASAAQSAPVPATAPPVVVNVNPAPAPPLVLAPPGQASDVPSTSGGTFNASTGITTFPDGSKILPGGVHVPAPVPAQPTTVAKSATVDGRTYTVTRAGLGIYQVTLASDPSVTYTFDQTGPLKQTGSAAAIKQLQADISKFPANLFTI